MVAEFALIWAVGLHPSLLGMDGMGAYMLWSVFEGLLTLLGYLCLSLLL